MAKSKRKRASKNDIISIPVAAKQQEQQTSTALEAGTSIQKLLIRKRGSDLGTPRTPPSLEKSAYKGGRGSNGATALPSAALDVASPKTPGRDWGSEVASPSSRPSLEKAANRGGRSIGGTPALPTIMRGPESLRQKQDRYRSPLHRTSGYQAVVAKIEYLGRIATWAAAKVPSLGAFYGRRLAVASDSAGISSPVLNSQCERCESVLLPGVNCSVRVVPKRSKRRRQRKGKVGKAANAVNMVVNRCIYCKHANQKPGTPAQHVKTKLVQASALAQMKNLASNGSGKACVSTDTTELGHAQVGPSHGGDSCAFPITPSASLPPTSANQADRTSGRKRKRKGWTGLKAMATLLQNRELPVPQKLGFTQDWSVPVDKKQKVPK